MVDSFYKIFSIQFSADVVACNRDPATNLVEVLDTYNVPFPIRNNMVDPTQDVILFNSSFDGARISCTLVEPALLSPVRDCSYKSNIIIAVAWFNFKESLHHNSLVVVL